MAIRVRKLAKNLGKTPVEVLGVLHAIGIERYKSPEDMLSATIEQKLRRAFIDGVRAVSVTPERVMRPSTQEPEAAPGWMPGVVPLKDDRFDERASGTAPAPQPVQPPTPTQVPPPAPAARNDAVDPLEKEREALLAAREALIAAKEALVAPVAVVAPPPPANRSLREVFEERGLRGADEIERAVRALAEGRRIPELLEYLSVADPVGLRGWLGEVLMLSDGTPPEGLGSMAVVAVAPERAEMPGKAAWEKLTEKISEGLLLQGLRRVQVVGGDVRVHRMLARSLDSRIEIRFRPGHRVHAPDAEADVSRTDLVLLWNIALPESVEPIYRSGRAVICQVEATTIRGMLEGWIKQL